MEPFRFGKQAGPNGRRIITTNGFLAVFTAVPGGRCHLEVSGPNGGQRALVIMDRAIAGKLGAALLKCAGVNTMDVLIAEQKKLLAEMNQGAA